MSDQSALSADRQFFQNLLTSNVAELSTSLTDDFILIAVTDGNEVAKPDLLAILESGQLRFTSIKPSAVSVRSYGNAAIVTGTTEMHASFGPDESTVHSRYTHVYILQDGRWMLASAQGTPIAQN